MHDDCHADAASVGVCGAWRDMGHEGTAQNRSNVLD